MNKLLSLFAASALCAGQAGAQSSDWSYTASLYGWFSGLKTTMDSPLGTINGELSGSDVISNLDAAMMAAFEARKGRWSLLLDGVYAKLEAKESAPLGAAFSEAIVTTKLAQITALALYNINQSSSTRVEIGGGLRWFDVDMGLTLTPGNLGTGRSISSAESWVDPVIAARIIAPINDKWTVTALVDYGGTGSDDKTWQALASVRYDFNDNWSAALGYRTLGLDHKIGGNRNKISLTGPFIAAAYRF